MIKYTLHVSLHAILCKGVHRTGFCIYTGTYILRWKPQMTTYIDLYTRVFIDLDFVYIPVPISCGENLKWQHKLICTRVAFISEETTEQNLPSYACMYLWLYLVVKRLGIVHTYTFYMIPMFKHNFTKYCEKIMLYKMQWIIQII